MDIEQEVLALARKHLRRVSHSGPYDVMALCPFHRKADGSMERTPSFALSLSKGVYFCHACEESGNLYTLLRHLGHTRDDIEYDYRRLIDAASRNIPPDPDPLRPGIVSTEPIPEKLLGLFDYCPVSLEEAGFTEETLRRFDVGFDKEHMRITFPLRDIRGNLVGISGRSVLSSSSRYKIYSSEYATWDMPPRKGWDKRTVLYNAHAVMPAVYYFTGTVEVFVVEGFKACMWLVQHGMTNTVALMGSYLSWEQKWILEAMGAVVYLFLDNDSSGHKGTEQAAQTLQRSIKVRIATYPQRLKNIKAQPDDLTAEELQRVKDNAITFAEYINHG